MILSSRSTGKLSPERSDLLHRFASVVDLATSASLAAFDAGASVEFDRCIADPTVSAPATIANQPTVLPDIAQDANHDSGSPSPYPTPKSLYGAKSIGFEDN